MAKGTVVGARLQADELAWLDDHARANGIQSGRGAALADVLRQFMAGPEAGAVLATLPKAEPKAPKVSRSAQTKAPPPVRARVHVDVQVGRDRPAYGSRLKKR